MEDQVTTSQTEEETTAPEGEVVEATETSEAVEETTETPEGEAASTEEAA